MNIRFGAVAVAVGMSLLACDPAQDSQDATVSAEGAGVTAQGTLSGGDTTTGGGTTSGGTTSSPPSSGGGSACGVGTDSCGTQTSFSCSADKRAQAQVIWTMLQRAAQRSLLPSADELAVLPVCLRTPVQTLAAYYQGRANLLGPLGQNYVASCSVATPTQPFTAPACDSVLPWENLLASAKNPFIVLETGLAAGTLASIYDVDPLAATIRSSYTSATTSVAAFDSVNNTSLTLTYLPAGTWTTLQGLTVGAPCVNKVFTVGTAVPAANLGYVVRKLGTTSTGQCSTAG